MLTRASWSNIEVDVFGDPGDSRARDFDGAACVLERKGGRVQSCLDLNQKFTDQSRVQVKAEIDERAHHGSGSVNDDVPEDFPTENCHAYLLLVHLCGLASLQCVGA